VPFYVYLFVAHLQGMFNFFFWGIYSTGYLPYFVVLLETILNKIIGESLSFLCLPFLSIGDIPLVSFRYNFILIIKNNRAWKYKGAYI